MRFLPPVLLALGFLTLLGTAEATPALVTDPTWLVTPNAPQPGWNTDPDFDDSTASGWSSSQIVPGAAAYGFPDSIWANSALSGDPLRAWFRKEFIVEETAPVGWMRFLVDDDAIVYLNGQVVLNDSDGLANLVDVDLTPYLVSGPNLIAIDARDGPLGVNRFIEARLYFQPIPEPGTASLLGLGLLALAARRPSGRASMTVHAGRGE
jgi:hypothetical protein